MCNILWTQISSGTRFIKTILEELTSQNNIILEVSDCFPWYTTFREELEQKIRHDDSIRIMEHVNSPANNVGEFLLEKYCEEKEINGYRPTVSICEYLASNNVTSFRNYYFWIHGLTELNKEEWIKFISSYVKSCGSSRDRAIFIIEAEKNLLPMQKLKGLKWLDFNNFFSKFDIYTYAIIRSGNLQINDVIKEYLSELLCSVCIDLELIDCCINEFNDFLYSTYDTLSKICENEVRENGLSFYTPVTKSHNSIKKIWIAQIKAVFPLLEQKRLRFIETYIREIEKILPIETPYGSFINNPIEVEWGMLSYIVYKYGILSKHSTLINLYKDARNILAHGDVMSFEMIQNVVNNY